MPENTDYKNSEITKITYSAFIRLVKCRMTDKKVRINVESVIFVISEFP